MYRTVELYSKPEEVIKEKINLFYSEMTTFQRSFLCGLIKEKRPKKIVEIGVSAGGTTTLVLQCLQLLDIESEVYSVDLMNMWYKNKKYETGFIAKEKIQNLNKHIKHKFLLGNSIPFFIKQIGEDIDFLILDTTHALPGEYLDFIVCLPFLKDGCVVVMHDTIENHLTYGDHEIATKLLLDMVRAKEKYYMLEEGIDIAGLPNIAAFKVGVETRLNIRDVFSAMTMPWGYLLDDCEMQLYRDIIHENYNEKYAELFDRIEILQRNTYLQKQIMEHYGKDAEYLKMKWKREKNIILYGAGYYANLYYHWAELNHLSIKGFVISDGQEKINNKNLPVYFLSELPYKYDECAIVLAIGKPYHRMILQNLQEAGYDNVL